MGTVVVVDLPDVSQVDAAAAGAVEGVVHWLHWVDATFSIFRSDSEISRIGRGELALDDASGDVRWVLRRCDELAALTDGDFCHRTGRADRPLDPNALVKGWAVDRAAEQLRMAGLGAFSINAGGDVRSTGRPARGPWRIGVRHPAIAEEMIAVIVGEDLAVATSGAYERGRHLRDATGAVAGDALTSVTVIAPDLATADALSTAVWAGQRVPPAWWARTSECELMVATADDRLLATAGFAPFLVSSSG